MQGVGQDSGTTPYHTAEWELPTRKFYLFALKSRLVSSPPSEWGEFGMFVFLSLFSPILVFLSRNNQALMLCWYVQSLYKTTPCRREFLSEVAQTEV